MNSYHVTLFFPIVFAFAALVFFRNRVARSVAVCLLAMFCFFYALALSGVINHSDLFDVSRSQDYKEGFELAVSLLRAQRGMLLSCFFALFILALFPVKR